MIVPEPAKSDCTRKVSQPEKCTERNRILFYRYPEGELFYKYLKMKLNGTAKYLKMRKPILNPSVEFPEMDLILHVSEPRKMKNRRNPKSTLNRKVNGPGKVN